MTATTHDNIVKITWSPEGEEPRPDQLDQLAFQLTQAATEEKAARERRVALEEQIDTIMGHKEEGAFSLETDYYKLTTTGRITRTIDEKVLSAIRDEIPNAIFERLIKWKPSLVLKEMHYIQRNEPDLYEALSQAITAKPAKTSVKVEEK